MNRLYHTLSNLLLVNSYLLYITTSINQKKQDKLINTCPFLTVTILKNKMYNAYVRIDGQFSAIIEGQI